MKVEEDFQLNLIGTRESHVILKDELYQVFFYEKMLEKENKGS